MKVCVLQPDYSQSQVDLRNYDPPRNLSHLLPEHQVDYVFLNKATTYRQLRGLKKQGYDIFINLCEGYRDWDIASCYDVITALEDLNLPYTGPTSTLYDIPKDVMKYVAYSAGVNTPAFVLAENLAEVENACRDLKFPLFVKPAAFGDSVGIDKKSYVTTFEELLSKATEIIANFDQALIEEYIPGREFTVLLTVNPDNASDPIAYKPIEFVFPTGEYFKTYDLKVKQHHPECYIPCSDELLDLRLRDAAKQVFLEMNRGGYARFDFRVNEKGEIFFLEINSPCTVFCPEGSEASADYILKLDDAGHSGFIKHIISEGIGRHQRRQKKYKVQRNVISGYGIYAIKDLKAGEIILPREERAQRIVTRSYVQSHWSAAKQESCLRYAYPVSEEVFILRDTNPTEWASVNHSSNPNMAFKGLDIVAIRDIAVGEKLTLDYFIFSHKNQNAADLVFEIS